MRIDGPQVLYGVYETEEDSGAGAGRWRTTHLLPADDPDPSLELPPGAMTNMAVAGVRCDEWFERWQAAKAGRRSVIQVGPRARWVGVDERPRSSSVAALVEAGDRRAPSSDLRGGRHR